MIESSWPMPRRGWPKDIEVIPYVLSAGPTTTTPSSWMEGSNCQRFAYGVLALFDLECPPLRSSNLWEDTESTTLVDNPQPLDLVLFNSSEEPFGAHVGIYMAPDQVLHLSQEIGRPAVWSFDEFAERPRYSTVIGIKRVIRRQLRI